MVVTSTPLHSCSRCVFAFRRGRDTGQDHFVEDGTQGLHYCQLEPYEDAVLDETDLEELEELHAKAKELCHGFLGPFRVSHGDASTPIPG